MVEANTELLAGAAVTVFLALLFFGVVVLWDVALALRSVGDKIDKLEDNIDDDLTDISHHLDGMSNAPGSGGGTQLHLSSGTISSGPGVSQPQQAPQTGQPQAGTQQAATGQSAPQGGVGPHPQSAPQQVDHRSQAASRDDDSSEELNETAAEAESPESATNEETAAEDDPDSEGAEPDEPTGDEPESDGTDGDEPAGGESGSDDTTDAADEPSEHPRAQRNRGRFITSPDRTAWYATPLDRAAIAAAQPEIAGALPDGSDDGIDDAEIIAAGPVGSSPAAETVDHNAKSTPDESAESDEEAAADSTADGESVTETQGGTDATSEAAREPSDRGQPESNDERDENGDENEAATENDADTAADTGSEDSDGTADDTKSATDTGAAADTEPAADTEDEAAEAATVSEAPAELAVHASDESDDTDHTEASAGVDEPSESATEDDAESETAGETDGSVDADSPPAADALSALEFDEDEFEADEDVTVEEAVETMNEAAPAPELSSHRFDVAAEGTDDDGAVVTLAFEDDTVDITGSTKRLLQYQLQSFANRESTPDGDVTIGRDRIVIELPDADGTAIQQWGDAAVSIVDRTLYLSDNSSDSHSNN